MPKYAPKKKSTIRNNDYRIAKLERKIVQTKPEVKYHYTTVSGTVANLAAVYYNLTNPAQGTGNDQRVGDTIRVQWIDIYVDVESEDIDIHCIKPLGGSDQTPGYGDISTSPGFFRPTEYKTYRRKFTQDDGVRTVKWRIPLGGLKVSFVDNTSTTTASVLLYFRNVGLLTRSLRGTCVCAFTDA